MSTTLIWIVLGWLVGYLVNQLADYLPAVREAEEPLAFRLTRPGLFSVGAGRKRPFLTELISLTLYGFLPTLIPNFTNLVVNSFHIAVLVLIIVIDLEHKLIFDIVTYPATVIALIGSFFVTNDENNIKLAIAGAIAGFIVFWILFKLAQLAYGAESGALGGGDVKLAMLMGGMLGFHRIFFALILAVLLGGLITFLLLASRRVTREMALPYGQYLAIAAIVMLIWGAAYAQNYLN